MDEEQDSAFTGDSKHSVLDISEDLRDDAFFKVVQDFLGSQSGEGSCFDIPPCKNRFLIQVGLMRQDNKASWGQIVKWLQNIFPMYHSSDFRSLIERSIATALSLSGNARENFLESDINFEYVGPICDTLGIGRTDLLEMSDFSDRAKCCEVTNGLILELSSFISREQMDVLVLVSWLRNFNPQFCSNGNIQKASKVLQTKLKKLKLDYPLYQRSTSRRNGMMEKFLQAKFELVPRVECGKTKKTSRKKKRFLKKYRNREKLTKLFHRGNDVLVATSKTINQDSLSQGNGGEKLKAKSEKNAKRNVNRFAVKSEHFSAVQSKPTNTILKVKEECDPSTNEHPLETPERTICSVGSPDSTKAEALTLLDVSMLSLQKLSSVYGEKTEESKQVSKDILHKNVLLMLNEDPVMKEFSEKVKKFQKVTPPLHFLDCNAHFLHEMSDAVEQQILALEREIILSTGEKLGRDNNPKFSSFVNFSESAASRYIRMACDVLSPRGETKHSCRKQWLNFCRAREKPSRLAVCQSNRFNNYFEGAAGLVHHHHDITSFFSDPVLFNTFDQLNVIQESVRDDASDQVIQALVCVLAIIYCKILGPYWQLLKSSAEYVYFHRYVHCLYQSLAQWSEDSSLLLLPEYSENNMFHQFPLQEKYFDGVFSYCRPNSENQYAALIRKCLEKIMKTIKTVTEANLKDFLPGGVYCQDPAPEISAKLRNCQLSHLMGEYAYGHAYLYKSQKLDHSAAAPMTKSLETSKDGSSLPQSGVATVLAHSTTNPVQISNEKITTPSEMAPHCQGKYTGSGMGKFFQMPRGDVDPKEKEKLLQDITTKNSILIAVAKNGGPCTNKQDVDHLLAKLDGASHAQKREAIRCEISYQKLILGSRDKNLNQIGFSLADMITKLKMVLPDNGNACVGTVIERSVCNKEDEMGHSQHNYTHEASYNPDPKSLIKRDINLGKKRIVTYKNYRENFEFKF
ncbi:solute carrier family 52, riboflavin transporter, member 2 isoform X2 [Conger conger]|nr:solute carrier family 52, riboflavin transporter, member 2 isoform X2 [Conger conger]